MMLKARPLQENFQFQSIRSRESLKIIQSKAMSVIQAYQSCRAHKGLSLEAPKVAPGSSLSSGYAAKVFPSESGHEFNFID